MALKVTKASNTIEIRMIQPFLETYLKKLSLFDPKPLSKTVYQSIFRCFISFLTKSHHYQTS